MTTLDTQAADLLHFEDDLRLTHYEATREMYEAKRDYYQLLMDTCDKLIQEIHQKRVTAPGISDADKLAMIDNELTTLNKILK